MSDTKFKKPHTYKVDERLFFEFVKNTPSISHLEYLAMKREYLLENMQKAGTSSHSKVKAVFNQADILWKEIHHRCSKIGII